MYEKGGCGRGGAGGGGLVGENSYQEYLENEMALVPASPHICTVSPTSTVDLLSRRLERYALP